MESMEVEDSKEPTQHKESKDSSPPSDSLPWVEKYRPADLRELISHEQIIDTITKLIDSNKLPHLLFYGPPGTGKTSTIHAVARKIYGKNFGSMILELNASDDRGIEVVRQQIKEFANTRNFFSKGVKLIILDEADAMTSPAQAALRRVIEKYTRSTRFCIICNYLNKIIPALQSRCTRFRFGPLKDEQVEERLQAIVKAEKIKITPNAVQAVVRLGQGDMRKCLNILQSAFMAYSDIDEHQIYQCTGNPEPKDVQRMMDWFLNEDFQACYKNVSKLQTTKGLALQDIISEVHMYALKIEFPPQLRIFLLDRLAEIEFRLSSGASEKINLGSLIGAFQFIRDQAASQETELQ